MEAPVQAEKKARAETATHSSHSSASSAALVLRNPRITEKGSMHGNIGAYLFDVAPSATKQEITHAVRAVYNVMPRMVRVVTVPSKLKRNSRTGKVGFKKGGKKAYVYLKKGEVITVS